MPKTLFQFNARGFVLDTAGRYRLSQRYFITLDSSSVQTFYTPVVYMPSEYTGNTINVIMFCSFAEEETDTAVLSVSWEASPLDLSSHSLGTTTSFDTEQTAIITPAYPIGGAVEATISFLNSEADNVSAGDIVQLKIQRNTGDASDTATGDVRVYALEVREV